MEKYLKSSDNWFTTVSKKLQTISATKKGAQVINIYSKEMPYDHRGGIEVNLQSFENKLKRNKDINRN